MGIVYVNIDISVTAGSIPLVDSSPAFAQIYFNVFAFNGGADVIGCGSYKMIYAVLETDGKGLSERYKVRINGY